MDSGRLGSGIEEVADAEIVAVWESVEIVTEDDWDVDDGTALEVTPPLEGAALSD